MEKINLEDYKINGKTLKELVGFEDSSVENLIKLSWTYYQQGKLDVAEKILRGLTAIDPENSLTHSALGAVLTRKGDAEDAIKELDVALELNPKDIAAYVNRGEAYFRLGRMEESIADFRKAIELDPEGKDSGANRARVILLGLSEVAKAVKDLPSK